jgi:hypothetical protein
VKYRPATWQEDLARALDRAMERQFQWWHHDCVTAACRMAGAAMGRDLLGFIQDGWDSAYKAERVLRMMGGVDGLLNVIARMSYLDTVAPQKAPRGSLVTIRDTAGQLCAGCLVGDRVAVVRESGAALAPAAWIEAAWADLS